MKERFDELTGDLRRKWLGFMEYSDLRVFLLFLIFAVLSIFTVMTASGSEMYEFIFRSSAGGSMWLSPIVKHIVIVVFCSLIAVSMSAIPFKVARYVRSVGTTLYVLGCLGLLILLFANGATINEASRWVYILGVSIQPSELCKLGVVLTLSMMSCLYLEQERSDWRAFLSYYGVGLACIGAVVLYFLYHNVSTGVIYVAAIAILLFIYKMPMKWYVPLLGGALLLVALGVGWLVSLDTPPSWGRLATAKSRLEKVIEPKTELSGAIEDDERQELYSQIALANGGLTGRGFGKSKIKEILPMAMSDYVYAVVVEETGVFGLLLVPALYVAWFILVLQLARREEEQFFRFVLYGIGIFYPMQALVNIIVVSGTVTTGQPLPFLSAGGSSALSSSIAFGIMLMISRWQTERQMEAERQRNEEMEASEEVPSIE